MLAVFHKSLIHSYLKEIRPDPFHYDYSYQLQFIIDHSTTHRSIPAQMSVDAMLPPDEPERLAALQRYKILDTPPDGAFNHLTAVAAALFRVPIAVVSLVDHDRIWFKSHYGLEVCETGREPGLCASAIFSPDVYHIRDALTDARALANPLVTKEVGLRFYAAAPLRTHDGFNLGTLSIMDRKARKLSVLEAGMLTKLAALVMDQMELRLAARKVADLERTERSISEQLREANEALAQSEERFRDLFEEVDAGRFRDDLFYRLSVFPIEVPPLRERREDIPPLAAHFVRQSARRINRPDLRMTQAALSELVAYDWPGNVRELQNIVERAVILSRGGSLRFDLVGKTGDAPRPRTQSALKPDLPTRDELRRQERDSIVAALKRTGGKIFGAGGAAELLGMKPTTLTSRIKALGLNRKTGV